MIDYTILYKRRLTIEDLETQSEPWDVFISAFNESERVQRVFEAVAAGAKHWLLQPEYDYQVAEHPDTGLVFSPGSRNEAEFLTEYITRASGSPVAGRVCVDITGFMRPHLMLLTKLLLESPDVDSFDVLYTDPVRYSKEERTEFTKGPVVEVRQVAGFEGQHVPEHDREDLLVIGTGYDDELIRRVAEFKANSRKVQMFGLPSLQPDMYQENVLRASRASEAVGASSDRDVCFAPANDPFATAAVLAETVHRYHEGDRVGNLYLCPVGTKPQALGFALYYLAEGEGGPCSMIFPFAEYYAKETSKGIARIWHYRVERLPAGP